MHTEQHEAWLREAMEGARPVADTRRDELVACATCGPELAAHEALLRELDAAGALERDVLAEVERGTVAGDRRAVPEFTSAQIVRLGGGLVPQPRARRWWIPLAAAAGIALCALVARSYLRTTEPEGANGPEHRPQLGTPGAFELLPPLRGPDGELTLSWSPIEGAYEYALELRAADAPNGPVLWARGGLAEPRCTIPVETALGLPKALIVRVQSSDEAGRAHSKQQASLSLP